MLRLFLAFVSCSVIALVGESSLAMPPIYGRNLIVNGDAEAGVGLPGLGTVPAWTTSGHFISVRYGYDGYPSRTDPGPASRGANLFSGGTNDPLSSASQYVRVASAAHDIDAGRVRYNFSAYIGGWSGQADYATVTALFLDGRGSNLGRVTLGPVTNAQRHNVTGLLYRSTAGGLPQGTRAIQVVIRSTRFEGASNDGYTDNISLVLRRR